ncbi:MAG: histidine kinase [Bacteroidales bacterium]
MNKTTQKSRSFLQRYQNNIMAKHPQIAIFLFVFILLFMGGVRFNPTISLILAVIDGIWVLVVYNYFSWLFIKQPYRFKSTLVNVICVILLVLIATNLAFFLEFLATHYLPVFKERESLPEEVRQLVRTYHFFKDLLLVMGALSVSIYSYSKQQEQQAEKLEEEKRMMNYQLLQSQINPHFLFNALNNIYALVYTKNDIAPDAILKLAEMLRYVTDESRSEKVLLNKELHYIKNYIDLQRMRMGCDEKIIFETHIDSHSAFIVPMILQPIIENCFNHGDIMTNPTGYVSVKLTVLNQVLTLEAENSITFSKQSKQSNREGIGLLNVEQRLKIYYKDAYALKMEEPNLHQYRVKLSIHLNSQNLIP